MDSGKDFSREVNVKLKTNRNWSIAAFIIGLIAFLLVLVLLILHFTHVNDPNQHETIFDIVSLSGSSSDAVTVNSSTVYIVGPTVTNYVLTLNRGTGLANQGTMIIVKNSSASTIKIQGGTNIIILPANTPQPMDLAAASNSINVSGGHSIFLISIGTDSNRNTSFIQLV